MNWVNKNKKIYHAPVTALALKTPLMYERNQMIENQCI